MSTSTTVPKATFAGASEQLPVLGFGAMGLSEFYGPGDDEDAKANVLPAVLKSGCTFIDTADMYGSGENEKLLGPFVQQNRDKIFLCTKFAVVRGPGGSIEGIRGDPAYVHEACDASLKRLGIDQIDLYYQHRVDPKTQIEDTVRAMKELQDAGKVKYLGLSECSADTLRRACKIAKISFVQWEYSLFTTDIETNGILDACKELGVTLVAYSPLGRGMLSADWKTEDDIPEGDFRKVLPRFKGEAFKSNMKLVHQIQQIAEKKGCTASALALKWIIDQGCLPIPGTKKAERVLDNVGAVEVNISEEEHKQIRQIIDEVQVQGDRYADMQGVNA